MMNKLLAAAALVLVACTDPTEAPRPLNPSYPAPTPHEQTPMTRVEPAEAGANICELLPQDGACSLACDPAALAEKYIPVNTCLSFDCTLTDGQTIRIGGCR